MTILSRRDFLKLTGAISASAYFSSLLPAQGGSQKSKVLILLFDTMSARHLSLYGYGRETTPHFSRFAERATVFHSHYSAGNFTTPGTASMLMGMYPWKHRAHTQGGLVRRDLADRNLFALFGSDYYRFSFAQTGWANLLMQQFRSDMEKNPLPTSFALTGSRFFMDRFLREKPLTSFVFEDFATHLVPDLPGTLLTGYLSTAYLLRGGSYYRDGFSDYPRGVPTMDVPNISFRLEDVFAGVLEEIRVAHAQPRPHLSYYHLFAPHDPFKPRREFLDLFDDDFVPLRKPDHPLSSQVKYQELVQKQQMYNRYIANVDSEFGLLMDTLEQDGLLEDTYVLVTSDHGELFERSTTGHGGPLIFDPVIHVPLMIRAPGQTQRVDIHTHTSNVDVLPTLLTLVGKQVPENLDGVLLPGLGGVEDPSRPIYSMVSPRSSSFGPLHEGTFVMIQNGYKLIYYRGYEDYQDAYELYDLQEDPDELVNLVDAAAPVAKRMQEQLLHALEEADQPYL